MTKVFSILTGGMVDDHRAARARPTLSTSQLKQLRDAATAQRAQADAILAALDLADAGAKDATAARAETARLRQEVERLSIAAPAIPPGAPTDEQTAAALDGYGGAIRFDVQRGADNRIRSLVSDRIAFDVQRDGGDRIVNLVRRKR